jgi:nitrogen fixation-related uncharacterized protein
MKVFLIILGIIQAISLGVFFWALKEAEEVEPYKDIYEL